MDQESLGVVAVGIALARRRRGQPDRASRRGNCTADGASRRRTCSTAECGARRGTRAAQLRAGLARGHGPGVAPILLRRRRSAVRGRHAKPPSAPQPERVAPAVRSFRRSRHPIPCRATVQTAWGGAGRPYRARRTAAGRSLAYATPSVPGLATSNIERRHGAVTPATAHQLAHWRDNALLSRPRHARWSPVSTVLGTCAPSSRAFLRVPAAEVEDAQSLEGVECRRVLHGGAVRAERLKSGQPAHGARSATRLSPVSSTRSAVMPPSASSSASPRGRVAMDAAPQARQTRERPDVRGCVIQLQHRQRRLVRQPEIHSADMRRRPAVSSRVTLAWWRRGEPTGPFRLGLLLGSSPGADPPSGGPDERGGAGLRGRRRLKRLSWRA